MNLQLVFEYEISVHFQVWKEELWTNNEFGNRFWPSQSMRGATTFLSLSLSLSLSLFLFSSLSSYLIQEPVSYVKHQKVKLFVSLLSHFGNWPRDQKKSKLKQVQALVTWRVLLSFGFIGTLTKWTNNCQQMWVWICAQVAQVLCLPLLNMTSKWPLQAKWYFGRPFEFYTHHWFFLSLTSATFHARESTHIYKHRNTKGFFLYMICVTASLTNFHFWPHHSEGEREKGHI